MLIDSHAHLMSSSFDNDREEVLKRALSNGIHKIINISTSPEELEQGLKLTGPIYHTASIHPHDAASYGEEAFSFVEKHINDLVAIGETGLDYHYDHSPKEKQQQTLRRYIQMAKRYDLPLVIHCREAFLDLFKIFDEEEFSGKAVLHCFTGTLEEAKEGLKRGFYISISGIITFKKSETLREVAKQIPLEKLLIETDCPFLAPLSHRGQRNEPAFLKETAETVALLKGLSLEEFGEITSDNVSTLFKI